MLLPRSQVYEWILFAASFVSLIAPHGIPVKMFILVAYHHTFLSTYCSSWVQFEENILKIFRTTLVLLDDRGILPTQFGVQGDHGF